MKNPHSIGYFRSSHHSHTLLLLPCPSTRKVPLSSGLSTSKPQYFSIWDGGTLRVPFANDVQRQSTISSTSDSQIGSRSLNVS
ncbi:hypothetical protein TNCV_4749791 [Trichonephila clavipes]|nr:hypothetical protein TNCV_4749791 [Trichonephila clavipes]